MATLLHMDASIRSDRSLSRALSRAFVTAWMKARPHDVVMRRDVAAEPPPHVTEAWVAAAFTPPEQRTEAQIQSLAASDALIAELVAADVVVVGTPMYNYGMPAPLKAWVDQVVRIGKTFSFDLARGDWPLEPVLGGKSFVLLTSSGEFGFAPGEIRESWNHFDTHLRTVAGYLGAAHVHHVAIEYQEFGDRRHTRSVADAHERVPKLVDAVMSELGLRPAGPRHTDKALPRANARMHG